MNECKVFFHPAFAEAVKDVAKLDEERTRLQTVMENNAFERVRRIIETQPLRTRTALYWSIYKATCAGQDFSRVDSMKDIAYIYTQFNGQGG